jgi:hypothetical protein
LTSASTHVSRLCSHYAAHSHVTAVTAPDRTATPTTTARQHQLSSESLCPGERPTKPAALTVTSSLERPARQFVPSRRWKNSWLRADNRARQSQVNLSSFQCATQRQGRSDPSHTHASCQRSNHSSAKLGPPQSPLISPATLSASAQQQQWPSTECPITGSRPSGVGPLGAPQCDPICDSTTKPEQRCRPS